MKSFTIILTVLVAMTIKTNAQIPNGGFETWENYVDNYTSYVYEKPDLWNGSLPNNLVHSFSIQKNPESYPAGTGQYSMKIQPDIANGVRGVAISNDGSDPMVNWIPKPSFAINQRPDSLFLYYKYFPFGGDTMIGKVYFYKNGVVIGNPVFGTTQTISSWTALAVPMTYNSLDIPDSATIFFVTGAYIQHSQSILYVDNLSFSGFVTSVPENILANVIFSLSPNPFSSTTTLQTDRVLKEATLTIYNLYGQIVKQIGNLAGQTIVFHRDNLPSGVYFIRITQNNKTISEDKFVITD